jgi:phosphoglycerate dehydrogenase-like enzyme
MTRRPATVLVMKPSFLGRLLPPDVRQRLVETADVDVDQVLTDYTSPALAEAEVLLTCWGAPPVDAAALTAAPALRAVVHAAGSVKSLITPEAWDRGIVVSSGADANAVPVAEYALAMILLAGKRAFTAQHIYRERRTREGGWAPPGLALGNYRRTVGIVSASRVGRRVLGLLRPFDLDVLVADPFLDADEARRLGARLVGLDELFAASEVVSLHAPAVPATHNMIGAAQLAALPDGATVINTARGWIIDHDALIAELRTGRINAVLDVTLPEPPSADSPLFDLPNVILTPHVAGAMDAEIARLGVSAVDELARYAAGEPFAHPVTREEYDRIA